MITDKGAVRAQFSTMTTLPAMDSVASANLDPASRTLAPGALVSIFGRNLAKVGTDLSGWEGTVIPESLNSVAVGAGSHRARLRFVSPTQITAQLPFELTPGAHGLAVDNGNSTSNVVGIPVAAVAPALFAGAILRRADNSLVSALNPAQPGGGDRGPSDRAAADHAGVVRVGHGQPSAGSQSGHYLIEYGERGRSVGTVGQAVSPNAT